MIAALAMIVEDEEKDKKRLIHDATHGVRVNHRIKCRDKLRAPRARKKKLLLLEAMERKERPFSIVGDIKKATAFKHLAKEHGFLACRLDSRDGPEGQLNNSCVYINKVGALAFGGPALLLVGLGNRQIAIVLSYCYLTSGLA